MLQGRVARGGRALRGVAREGDFLSVEYRKALAAWVKRPGATIRFYYYVNKPTELRLNAWCPKKQCNFYRRDLQSGETGRWVQVKLPVDRLNGKVPMEDGDEIWGLQIFVKSQPGLEFYIDDVVIE